MEAEKGHKECVDDTKLQIDKKPDYFKDIWVGCKHPQCLTTT